MPAVRLMASAALEARLTSRFYAVAVGLAATVAVLACSRSSAAANGDNVELLCSVAVDFAAASQLNRKLNLPIACIDP